MHIFRLAVATTIFFLAPFLQASTIGGSGGGFSGSGTFTTISNGDGSYTITSISGASAGVGALLAPGSFHNNDNQLFPSASSIVDTQGFAFTDTQGNTSFMVDILQNSASSTGYSAFYLDSDNASGLVDVMLTLSPGNTYNATPSFTPYVATTNFNFSFAPAVAATPEPSSLALLGTGCIGIFTLLRRRTMY